MPKELTQHIVENWISLATGSFQLYDVCRELNITTEEGKSTLRMIMHRLVIKGMVERVKGKDGIFRPVNASAEEIKFDEVETSAVIPLVLPFEISSYVEIYQKNVVLVAGESNAGKTCFLYNVAANNMYIMETVFFTNNEATPQEIAKRIKPLGIPIPPPFKIYERYDNYADVIVPDALNIIDYLDMNSEVYLAGDEIERVHQKLRKGIAVIGMQLPPPVKTLFRGVEKIQHRSLAYGGAFTIKKPVLYLNLWCNGGQNQGICRIEKAKNRAQPRVDPNNMMWKYTIDSFGAKFISYERYRKTDVIQEEF
jgi:hypothetical protein